MSPSIIHIRQPTKVELLDKDNKIIQGDIDGDLEPIRKRAVILTTNNRSKLCLLSDDIIAAGSDDRHQSLQWYFEQFPIRDPFGTSRAEAIRRELLDLGKGLIRELFHNNSDWLGLFQESLVVQIHDSEEKDEAYSIWFDRLCWELLTDKALWNDVDNAYEDRLGSVHVTRVHGSWTAVQRQASLNKMLADEKRSNGRNVIAVTARPSARDIPHRLITRSIASAVGEISKSSSQAASLTIVRPGTFDTLVAFLKKRPRGFFDILHLDVHGESDNDG